MTETEIIARLDKGLRELDASIAHVNEVNHRRLAKLEAEVALDVSEMRATLREAEDGIVRHRDAIMREFTAIAAENRSLSRRLDLLEAAMRIYGARS